MSDTLAAVILGLVQGLTEFLPVSSTAHLILAARLFGLDPERFGLTFDVALHLGTALAVLLFFLPTWLGLARDALARRWRVPGLIVLGTIPAAVAGVLLQSAVERELRGPLPIAIGLIAGSLVFLLAERGATRSREGLRQLSLGDSLAMGCAQAVALLPGVSRSGITISAGLARGLARADAARLSFLLATPVILGAGAKTLLDARRSADLATHLDVAALGFIVSFLSGLAAVAFLVRFLRTRSLAWFVPYRLLLAAAVLLGAFGT